MSSALVGNRKDIQPLNSAPIISHGMYFPSLLFLHCHPFSCLRRKWWDDVKEDVWREKVIGKLAKVIVQDVCVFFL